MLFRSTNVACKKQGWYTGLSEEKKAQHLQKLRLARLEKKVAAKSVTANVPQSHTPPLSTVMYVGPVDHDTYSPLRMREVALIDTGMRIIFLHIF